MNVAYRLSPETDIMGMVNDVKRAIVWMKEKAGTYGINPNRIVVGGGSAGGHLPGRIRLKPSPGFGPFAEDP